MRTALQDIRYGLRILHRAPAFAGVAIATLALGMGGNAVMFSVVHSVLLRPLPYRDAGHVAIVQTIQKVTHQPWGTAPPDFYTLRRQQRTLEHLASFYVSSRNLTGTQEPERVRAMVISSEFFQLLGRGPAIGRSFAASDEEWGLHRVVILSDGLWRRRFAGDPAIVGGTIRLNGEPHHVVGVMPVGFSFAGLGAQLYLPMSFAPGDNLNTHNNYFLTMVGRLKADVRGEQANEDLNAIMQEIEREHPENKGLGVALTPLQEALVEGVRRSILVLMAAVGFVLLIACANLANLLLARAAARRPEVAVRAALGASRARLLRQFLTESVVLSLAGAMAGLALAYWTINTLNLLPQTTLPRAQEISLDRSVLAFTVAIAFLTGIIFGVAPALHASRSVNDALKEGGRGTDRASGLHWTRGALVVVEVALSLVLLIGAGLMIKSVYRQLHVDSGFDADSVLTLEVALPREKYVNQQLERQFSRQAFVRVNQFFDSALARLRAMPGVRAASAVSGLPLAGENWGKNLTFYDRPLPAMVRDLPAIQYRVVAGDYFRALGIRILQGRAFEDGDTLEARPVAIVNRALVRQYWNGQDPLGKVISVNPPRELVPAGTVPPDYQPEKFTVVGVADDVRYGGLTRDPLPVVYVPFAQGSEGATAMFFVVRTAGDPLAFATAIREQIRQIDPDQPVANIRTMDSRVADAVARPRLATTLLGAFAALAVVLAAGGIYSLASYMAAQRRHEIGIRMALGATPHHVLEMMLRQGLRLAALGLILGLAGSMAATRVLSTLLFGVSFTDPAVFGMVAVLLATVAVLASYFPARSATRVDPMAVLRYE